MWSVDREEWIALGELQEYERVQTRSGPIHLLSLQRALPADVFNIEVDCEHVYEVGDVGVLVHNTCSGYHHYSPRAWGSNVPYGPKHLGDRLTAVEHTDIPRSFSDFLKVKHGHYFNSKSGDSWQTNISKFERIRTLIEFHKSYNSGDAYANFAQEVKNAFKNGYKPFG